MKKTALIIIACLLAAGGIFWLNRGKIFHAKNGKLVLYGNVDDRQINLSFQYSERIAEILKEEGDIVKKGDILAKLETERIRNAIGSARAAVNAARAKYEKMRNGSRKEDIEIARAILEGAKAKLYQAEQDHQRQRTLKDASAVSVQIAEKAESVCLLSKAAVRAAQSELDKLLAGERAEDIALAKAEYEKTCVNLQIEEQKLRDAVLTAPCDGIIRSRIQHPGEMTSPQKAVLTLAVISPKWVRVYIPETRLTNIRNGDRAEIHFDSMAGQPLHGWVGFISPNAEFTPKNVETEELRTSLVYEMRVMVNDPENRLKLGAPATVIFPGSAK